jgi:hypothetical protein
MSWSVTGSNAGNPFAFLQSLWPQNASANGAQGQSDPLSSLLSALDQQNPGTQNPGANASSPTSPTAGTPGGSSTNTQFGPQTLQALLALQTDSSNPQSLASQLTDAMNEVDSASSQQAGASQGQGGHHRHHHVGAGGGGQNLLSLLAGANGSATTQTTTNPNGTTTTSITYADGSTVSTTTAAPSGTAGSDVTSSSAGGANVTGGNLLERLIQMQAQLLAPASTQSVTA